MATLSFSITVPDDKQAEIVDTLAKAHGWTATLPDGTPNPETRAQAARRGVVQYLKSTYREYKAFLDTQVTKAATDAATAAVAID